MVYINKRVGGFDKEISFGVCSASEMGNIVWTCVKDNIIEETEEYKAIGLHGFDYK